MTVSVDQIANTDTFEKWLEVTNQLANVVSSQAVTTDSTAATGNAGITGTFTANTLVIGNGVSNITINSTSFSISLLTSNSLILSNNVIVGNSTVNTYINSSSISISNTTANLNISIPTPTQMSNGQYYLNANGSWVIVASGGGGGGGGSNSISNNQTNTSGTSDQLIDSWSTSSFNGAEYVVVVVDNVSNNRYASKMLTVHDGASGFITEYGAITTNNSVGTFSANVNGTILRLYFAPVSTNTSVKFARVLL